MKVWHRHTTRECDLSRWEQTVRPQFRSALHLFVKDKGSAKAQGERHLKSALKHMKDDEDLHRSLSDRGRA